MTAVERVARRRRPHDGPELPLHLPTPPPPWSWLAPEVATPCSDAFDDEGWRFSVDWDGCRALLIADDDSGVELRSEKHSDLAERFPEIAAATARLRRRPVVLDGVVVTLDSQGRPDLEVLGLRIALGAAGGAQFPAVFLATDVLHLGDRGMTDWAFERRVSVLGDLFGDQRTVQAPDVVHRHGAAFAEAAGRRGLSAVLGRRASAPYRSGMSSPDRLRISLRPRVTAVLAGIEQAGERALLLLAEYDCGRLVYSGRVRGPRHAVVERWLAERAGDLAIAHAALVPDDGASMPRGAGVMWMRPELTVTVEHRGRGRDGTLREPSFIALRDDADPRWCVRREAMPPPVHTPARAFAPTVLLPLPLQ
ncbi:MAG: hypothetical protein ABR498_06870 [Candidatus Dormibacteria bacterium]